MNAPIEIPPDTWVRAARALITRQPVDLRDDLWITFNERAGIAEYVGELSRTDAERLAFRELRLAVGFQIQAA